ncbi:MAG: hypothetical protein WC026_10285 [Hyphomicrobium sp.]|uniref:hypothetical protein n=1 Tax=Hyphomicrobium sp. TaxID=82 RepID=UPI0035648094
MLASGPLPIARRPEKAASTAARISSLGEALGGANVSRYAGKSFTMAALHNAAFVSVFAWK